MDSKTFAEILFELTPFMKEFFTWLESYVTEEGYFFQFL